MNDAVIDGVNIALRCLSLLLGIMLGIKHKRKGLAKGICVGLVYVVTTYLVYGIVGGNFAIDALKCIDAVSNVVFGAISGIIAVNIKSKKQI